MVLDRFSPQQRDSKPRGCTEPMETMESWMMSGGVRVGGSGGGGEPAADMTQDPQSKQSFQTDYHSCLFEEG